MPSSLILTQELRSVARRWGTYRQRVVVGTAMLLALGSPYITAYFQPPRLMTIGEMAGFAEYVFGLAALTQVLLTIWLVPACVAGAIAEEKERRRLTQLLTTQLTSVEIVVGKLAAGLVQYASCLATGLPILIGLRLFGGIDRRWILLTYAATCSTAYFMAGLSIVVSTTAKTAARAVGAAVGLASVWCCLPVSIQLRVPSTLPWLWPWISASNEWVLASSPAGVILAATGGGPAWGFVDSIIWMIELQLALGTILVAWAAARFRGACRAGEESENSARSPRRRSRPLGRRHLDWAPYDENPVLWKELEMARPRGFVMGVALLVALAFVFWIGYETCAFARPAFEEWRASGFGRATREVQRAAFNEYLRFVSPVIEFVILLLVALGAAAGVTAERARETWDSLTATPLSGRAILRAKAVGAVWKVRWGLLLLLVLWVAGLMTGSLHPLGLVAALLLLGVSVGFMTALGTYQSLVSRDTPQASNRTLVPAMLLMCSFVACYLPARVASVLMGCGSAPFLTWLSLVSYADVDEIVSGNETFGRLESIEINTYETPLRALAAYLIGAAGLGAGTFWLSRAAVIHFEKTFGPPERATRASEGLEATASVRSGGRFETARQRGSGPHSLLREAVTTGRGRSILDLTGTAGGLAPWGRSWRRTGMVLVLVSVLIMIGIAYVIPSWRDRWALQDAVAETDRLYPRWRLEDLEAARRQVPEAANGALRILDARSALPARWRGAGELRSDAEQERGNVVALLSPPQCLTPGTLRSLQAELNKVTPALAEARAIVDFSEGRFPVDWASDGISTQLHHIAQTRDIVNLLAYDILVRCHNQDTDEALSTCRALLNAGRAIGDEPTAVSQLLRIDIRMTVCHQAEFALAHGQASESALAKLQHDLDAEEREPLLSVGIKGERALVDRFLTSIESGAFSPKQVRNTNLFSMILHIFRHSAAVRGAHLRFCNCVEGFLKLPAVEQLAAFEKLGASDEDVPPPVRAIFPAMRRLAGAFQNSRASLRCAAVALAAERYRLARSTWPNALEALVPDFLTNVPADPFGGEPLHLRRFADRIVIYSVAEDGRDDGDETESTSSPRTSRDLGFRLWDPPRRHQVATKH